MQFIKRLILGEDGDEMVEFAVLFPILLFIAMFISDRFITYEGLTSTSSATNEAIRYSVVAENQSEAESIIKETLSDRLEATGMGWCADPDNMDKCVQWGNNVTTVKDEAEFKRNKSAKLLINVDNKKWCNGSYITVGVRAHKASLIPSYENFRRLMTDGGPIYHTHTYVVKARVESNEKCE